MKIYCFVKFIVHSWLTSHLSTIQIYHLKNKIMENIRSRFYSRRKHGSNFANNQYSWAKWNRAERISCYCDYIVALRKYTISRGPEAKLGNRIYKVRIISVQTKINILWTRIDLISLFFYHFVCVYYCKYPDSGKCE